MSSDEPDVIVIGAGQAGMAVAYGVSCGPARATRTARPGPLGGAGERVRQKKAKGWPGRTFSVMREGNSQSPFG